MKNTAKLPTKFKKDLLKALRSGDYGRIRNQLHDGKNGYCCLGVACKVAGHTKNIKIYGGKDYPKKKLFRNVPSILCDSASSEIYENNKSSYNGRTVISILAGMNDSGKSFNKIADWIEKNL